MRDRDLWSVSGKFFSIDDDPPTMSAGGGMMVQNCTAWKLGTFIQCSNANNTTSNHCTMHGGDINSTQSDDTHTWPTSMGPYRNCRPRLAPKPIRTPSNNCDVSKCDSQRSNNNNCTLNCETMANDNDRNQGIRLSGVETSIPQHNLSHLQNDQNPNVAVFSFTTDESARKKFMEKCVKASDSKDHDDCRRKAQKDLKASPTARSSPLGSTFDDCNHHRSGPTKPNADSDDNDKIHFLLGNHCDSEKKATKQQDREQFQRHKSVSSFTNFAASRLAGSTPHKATASCDYIDSDKEQYRDGGDDRQDYARSLPCLINGGDIQFHTFTSKQIALKHQASDEKIGGDPSLETGRIQFQQKRDAKVGSIRTTKLRRQNACRQKSNPTQHSVARSVAEKLGNVQQTRLCPSRCRDPCEAPSLATRGKFGNDNIYRHVKQHDCRSLDFLDNCKDTSDDMISRKEVTTVRSRSLNHLDTLEMRQGNAPVASGSTTQSTTNAADAGCLKDAKSEPDCTSTTSGRPLLALPDPVASNISPTSSSTSPSPTNRRHMLSRSQKSSSECFSVNFEVGDESTYDSELFFPAARGITLHESLSKLCELRNIELSTCDVWLCNRETNAQSWLSLSQDTACLVGKHVKLTAKDSTRSLGSKPGLLQSHSRKLSGNFRPRTTSFFSTSTEESGDYDGAKKVSKQRWSTNLFGNSKDSKQSMEQLIEHLNHYSRYGVPRMQNFALSRSDSQDALNKLEDDWREIIDTTDLTEKQQKQQTALWELIKTEVAYIKTLKVVTELFLACLLNLQSSNILRDIDTNKLFSNINDILDANVQFWRRYLFPLVKDMRTYCRPACLETMCEGFLKLKDCFQAYYRFCGEQSRCQHYCRENLSHNELFTAYLAWCETQKECNRLRLMDILVQPMQRLTKYGLLLKAILRNSEDEVDRDNLNIMIRSVDDFVNNVNFSLKQKQDNERLKGIIARIESYDIVETKDDDLEKLVRNYNQLDLTKPMLNCCPERRRHLLLEGDLKFKDSNTSKMEVHCFLLTDMLLVCKQSTKKGGATMRVIRQPFLIDKLLVTEIHKETPTLACVYRNELDMAVSAFLLQNSDAKKLRSWKDGVAKAQTLYAQAKQSYLPTNEESLDAECSFECSMESDFHCLQAPRSPLATSSRASRVSSLAHSHSGSVEMNDQSSLGSCKATETENRTASVSSDEGMQSLPPDQKSPSGSVSGPASAKNSFKTHRIFGKTPNTLSVQPTYSHQLGQSLPNLTLGSPNTLTSNTLSVPSTSKNGQLLSPTHRGISYPPPSPTRANLRRGMAINQSKNPPLIKTRHITSSTSTAGGGDFDVPVIAGMKGEFPDVQEFGDFSRGQHRQAMKRAHRSDNRRYHTAGTVDDIKKENSKELLVSASSILKRSSWNCSSTPSQILTQPQTLTQNNNGNNEEKT